MALFAHCVALTVNAVKLPWERRPRAMATADRLAEAVSLDMTGYWRPTVRTYLGRVTKARILEAVREGVSIEAADRMADMKKQDMAEAAEQLLAATGLAARADADAESRARACRSTRRRMLPRRRTQTPTPTPPSDRHGRDRSMRSRPFVCNCRKFRPRAFRRAAIVMILTPSTASTFRKRNAFAEAESARRGRARTPARRDSDRRSGWISRRCGGPDQREAVVAVTLDQRGQIVGAKLGSISSDHRDSRAGSRAVFCQARPTGARRCEIDALSFARVTPSSSLMRGYASLCCDR